MPFLASSGDDDVASAIGVETTLVVLNVMLYVLLGHQMDVRRQHVSSDDVAAASSSSSSRASCWMHQSGLAVVLGAVTGLALKRSGRAHYSMGQSQFFYLLLPPIVFAQGFTLKRRKFFKNVGHILLLGVVGTALQVVLLAVAARWVTATLGIGGLEGGLSGFGCVLLAVVLCPSDEVAVLSFLRPASFPKLGAVLFGEGVVNDSLSVLMLHTLLKIRSGDEEKGAAAAAAMGLPVTLESLGHIGVRLLAGLAGCVAVGASVGLGVSYMVKHVPTLRQQPVRETVLVLAGGYLSYALAQLPALNLSGALALFFCGVILGHYAWHSLSPHAQLSTRLVFQSLAMLAESFTFAFLGIGLVDAHWSTDSSGATSTTLLGGRSSNNASSSSSSSVITAGRQGRLLLDAARAGGRRGGSGSGGGHGSVVALVAVMLVGMIFSRLIVVVVLCELTKCFAKLLALCAVCAKACRRAWTGCCRRCRRCCCCGGAGDDGGEENTKDDDDLDLNLHLGDIGDKEHLPVLTAGKTAQYGTTARHRDGLTGGDFLGMRAGSRSMDGFMSFREQLVLTSAGLVRGAIAWALVLQIRPATFVPDLASLPHWEVRRLAEERLIASTALGVVVFTTLVVGSLLPCLLPCLLPRLGTYSYKNRRALNLEQEVFGLGRGRGASFDPAEDEMVAEDDEDTRSRRRRSSSSSSSSSCCSCHRAWSRFDNAVMKPCFGGSKPGASLSSSSSSSTPLLASSYSRSGVGMAGAGAMQRRGGGGQGGGGGGGGGGSSGSTTSATIIAGLQKRRSASGGAVGWAYSS